MINLFESGQMHPFEGQCNLSDIVLALRDVEDYVSKANLMDSFDSSGAGRRVGNVRHNNCDMGLGGDRLAWWLVNNVWIGGINVGDA